MFVLPPLSPFLSVLPCIWFVCAATLYQVSIDHPISSLSLIKRQGNSVV